MDFLNTIISIIAGLMAIIGGLYGFWKWLEPSISRPPAPSPYKSQIAPGRKARSLVQHIPGWLMWSGMMAVFGGLLGSQWGIENAIFGAVTIGGGWAIATAIVLVGDYLGGNL